MTEAPQEAYGPRGDSSRHLSFPELEAGFSALEPPSSDSGTLVLIVRRRADGVRETPDSVRLTPEGGVPGDRWGRQPPLDPDAQLTVMRRDVAELVANGQPLTLFGDNLFVDLDISASNLPFGARLQLGEAVVEMTPKPHNGCSKFKERFGEDALRFVNQESTRGQNLRGVYWKVIAAAQVSVGARIQVVSRQPRDADSV